MAENVSFNEQEQHILINNNFWEDGFLINNKNKVDFTIGKNQLQDSNMNEVGTFKSFFRVDSNYGLMINQMKFFHYHKVNQINTRRSVLKNHHKNQWVINAREPLKHIEDCNNIDDHARNIKSLNQTWQYYLRNLFLSPQIHVIIYRTRIKDSSKVK